MNSEQAVELLDKVTNINNICGSLYAFVAFTVCVVLPLAALVWFFIKFFGPFFGRIF